MEGEGKEGKEGKNTHTDTHKHIHTYTDTHMKMSHIPQNHKVVCSTKYTNKT